MHSKPLYSQLLIRPKVKFVESKIQKKVLMIRPKVKFVESKIQKKVNINRQNPPDILYLNILFYNFFLQQNSCAIHVYKTLYCFNRPSVDTMVTVQ
jgi:uncharacterized pyridoxamine 5'-phosphate oxidase family protein